MHKEYKTRYDSVGMVNFWKSYEKNQIWPYEQIVYAQPRIRPWE